MRLPLILLIIFLGCPAGVSAQDKPVKNASESEKERPFADLEEEFSERQKMLMKEFQAWYDKSRDAGEKGKDWLVNDIKNIGDWEYLIVTLSAADEEELALQLNVYGRERWEVYWVQKTMQGVQFYLKRQVRTYIKHIPVGDLLHMVPSSPQP